MLLLQRRSDFTLDLWRWLGKVVPETDPNMKPVEMYELGLNVWYVQNARGDVIIYYDAQKWKLAPEYRSLEPSTVRHELEGTDIRVIDALRGMGLSTIRPMLARILCPLAGAMWRTGRLSPQKAEKVIPATERGWGH
jgi:hypothetical protein